MLWDLTWLFIDEYGFDPDLTNGNGGNNMIMQLVIDGFIDLFIEKLKVISINFRFSENNLISEIFLNNRNVEKEIGSLEVSNYAVAS